MSNVKHSILMVSLSAAAALTALNGCTWSQQKEARETGRTTMQVADDRHISERVADSLKASPVYKFPDVGVKTFDRVVQLHGFVQTEDQKHAAEEIAQQAPGAVRVINDIVVQPQPTEAQNTPPQSLPPTGRNNRPNNQPGS